MINSNLTSFIPEYEELYKMFPFTTDNEIFVYGEVKGDLFESKATLGEIEERVTERVMCFDDIEKKRYLKRFTKLCLYRVLSSFFGIKLPWGALTGIRPVKFAKSFDNFEKEFKEVFDVGGDKIGLVKEIISTQKTLAVDENKVDLYVGIPFCPTKCSYCSFVSGAINKNTPVDEYIEALCYEIAEQKSIFEDKIGTVYIGGGTPASLDVRQTEKLFKALNVKNGTEFTFEAGRPDCITREKLELYNDYGVTRICVNPQSFNQKTLDEIGRKHTPEDTERAFNMAKEFGFIVNMDLIAGLPEENFDDFKYSLDKTIELFPENVTVHTLCLKAGSGMKQKCERLSGDEIGKMLSYAHEKLTEKSFNPYYLYRQKYMAGNYENVGYSLKGKECLYNVGVMEEVTCNPAFGTNANSKIVFNGGEKILRYYPPRDVKTYIEKIEDISQEKIKFFEKKFAI